MFKKNSSAQAAELEIEAQAEHISFHNATNGWTVLTAKDSDSAQPFVIVGFFPKIETGEYYLLTGKWHQHPTFGKQFQVSKSQLSQPKKKEAIIRYLSSDLFKGIGEKTSQLIVGHFGNTTIDILNNNPSKLKEIPKLSHKRIQTIQISWEKQRQRSETLLFLFTHGLTAKTAVKVMNHYGTQTKAILSSNPYCLIKDIKGFGFLTADRIARSLGLAKDHPQRIEEAILYVLKKSTEQGHCYLTRKQVHQELYKVLELEAQQIEKVVEDSFEDLHADDRVVSCNSLKQNTLLHYLIDLYLAEKNIAARLIQIKDTPFNFRDLKSSNLEKRVHLWLGKYVQKKDIELSEEQYSAIIQSALNKIFIITGGPGVGKTTISNIIIELFKAMGRSVLIGAPTGRAAKRISEVSHYPAKTIHRLLEWSATEQRFLRNEENPLPADVLIIDESSMIDTWLCDKLLRAVSIQTQVIFVGDVDQLPSVGPGNVLRDLIASDALTYIKLQTVYRQALDSRIIHCAHLINSGEYPSFSNQQTSDCRFIEAHSIDDYQVILTQLFTHSLYDAGYDLKRDVQVLTPMNLGPLGSKALNLKLQAMLNTTKKNSQQFHNKDFCLKKQDKVIQLSNNYDLNVFNGDIGYISQVNVENGKVLVNFGDRMVAYQQEQAFDLTLAYAISIHKSQGSEFPVVIIILSTQHYHMLQRNLIYTALTRAKKLAIFIGMPAALHQAISNNKSSQRQSQLIDHLS